MAKNMVKTAPGKLTGSAAGGLGRIEKSAQAPAMGSSKKALNK